MSYGVPGARLTGPSCRARAMVQPCALKAFHAAFFLTVALVVAVSAVAAAEEDSPRSAAAAAAAERRRRRLRSDVNQVSLCVAFALALGNCVWSSIVLPLGKAFSIPAPCPAGSAH